MDSKSSALGLSFGVLGALTVAAVSARRGGRRGGILATNGESGALDLNGDLKMDLEKDLKKDLKKDEKKDEKTHNLDTALDSGAMDINNTVDTKSEVQNNSTAAATNTNTATTAATNTTNTTNTTTSVSSIKTASPLPSPSRSRLLQSLPPKPKTVTTGTQTRESNRSRMKEVSCTPLKSSPRKKKEQGLKENNMDEPMVKKVRDRVRKGCEKSH